MTEPDQPTQRAADALTPAQSEAVRRLLAGARDDQGIPDDVAARLEAVLAELSAERADAPAEADVIPLRRRWPKVLVAAAAVTIFGFGAVQVIGSGAGDNDAGGDAAVKGESADGRDLGSSVAPPEVGADTPDSLPGATAPTDGTAARGLNGVTLLSQRSLDRIGLAGLRQLDAGTLDEDLRRLTVASAPTSEYSAGYSEYDVSAARVRCGPFYTVFGGETFAASFRQHLALVLFHPRLDGVRLVEIYDCESATPRRAIRTVTLQTGE